MSTQESTRASRALKFARDVVGAAWALGEAVFRLAARWCVAVGVVGLVLWLLFDLVMQLVGGVFG
jgi:hypothetical protein